MTSSGFNLYTGNRLECLAEIFAEKIAEPLASPFAPEIVVLQSKGMERWLSMEVAQKNGICANFSFFFPNTFLDSLYWKCLPDIFMSALFETDGLTFTIMKLLPDCLEMPCFSSLRRYLSDQNDDLKTFQISSKIADIFEQYIIFRPEMILKWEKGESEGEDSIWQAELWRRIIAEKDARHPARLRENLLKALMNGYVISAKFPQRVSIFGISSLPEIYMQLFAALARIIEVNIYLLNPCREYWGDIDSLSEAETEAEISWFKKKYSSRGASTEGLHLKQSSSLLSSLGKMGRDFFKFINLFNCNLFEQFHPNSDISMLAYLQNDILCMCDHKYQVDPVNDKSIQINSCHSPMREIEALHDNLLAMFADNPDLLPKDIIVMAPDIELYAPYIHAVFDSRFDQNTRIPFSIADRSVENESGIIDTFLAILELRDSRFGTTQVLDLLQFPVINAKFLLGKTDVEIITTWIRATNIRWGIDKESRGKLHLPLFFENTWKAGIERLLLGYAMPGYGKKMFAGILPYDDIEGADVKILGRFIDFTEALFSCAEGLGKDKGLSSWSIFLNRIIDEFLFIDDDGEYEIQVVRQIINNLQAIEDATDFNKKISLDVLKAYLAGALRKKSFGAGFISGGVTFCAMLPMRSIPFKVICLIGMNHDAFPRDEQSLSFDLIAKKPKLLDRFRRNDDKYLFLESIISARDKLYISYIGQSIQDNTSIPPSVLVSELIDQMEKSFAIPGQKIEKHVVVKHRLQAFSPEYFKDGSGLFSYSITNYKAAMALLQTEKHDPPPFLSTKLAQPEKLTNIAIKELFDFFSHPVKYFLNKHFGIYLSEANRTKDDKEDFKLDGLDRYIAGSALVQESLDGMEINQYLTIQRAAGLLPHGNIGEYCYREISVDALEFVKIIQEYTKAGMLEPVDFALDLKGINLYGRLYNLYAHGIVTIRYGAARTKDFLRSWLSHLILCSLKNRKNNKEFPCKNFLVCKDSVWEFTFLEQSDRILGDLISIFNQGLSEAVKFFPESSLKYAKQLLHENRTPSAALKSAMQVWAGNGYTKGESENLYNRLCFGKFQGQTVTPVNEEFQAVSEKIFTPLFNHCIAKKISTAKKK